MAANGRPDEVLLLQVVLRNSILVQVLLDSVRVSAARLGLPIRPHVFLPKDMKSPEEEKHEEEAPSPKESATGSYTPCETLFLRLQHEKRGVMQLHKATWQDRRAACKREGHDT